MSVKIIENFITYCLHAIASCSCCGYELDGLSNRLLDFCLLFNLETDEKNEKDIVYQPYQTSIFGCIFKKQATQSKN